MTVSNVNDKIYMIGGTEIRWPHDPLAEVWECGLEFLSPVGVQFESNEEIIPRDFALRQNYPNPFNLSTNITFSLPHSEDITVKVYNILGQEIATLMSAKLPPGNYQYEWSAEGLASGLYFVEMKAGDFTDVKKAVLLK